ncbi:MAG: hypothetical protein GX163_11345 [Bacteroidetes bacterium]|jgi:hypothetical protein|nr:hypothetical protein [Bacteroidota bacterium]
MAGEFTTDMGVLAGIQELNNRFEWYYGDVEPVNPRPFLNWGHLAEDLWKQRNAQNTAWIVRGKLSEAFFGLAPLSMVYTKNEADNKFVTYEALPPHGAILFDASGQYQFTAPADVLYITCCGGGGGGGGGTSTTGGSGGGGAGAVVKAEVAVTPGDNISINVGVGGNGGTANNSGGAGGISSFGGFVSVSGGGGGQAGSVIGGIAGGSGGSNGAGNMGTYGGHGGGCVFGVGGAGATHSQYAGSSGGGYGGGGGGGYGTSSGNGHAGGKGSPGFVLIEW